MIPVPRKVWVAHLGGDAGRLSATAHHLPSVRPVETLAVENRLPPAVGANLDGLENHSLGSPYDRSLTLYPRSFKEILWLQLPDKFHP